MAADMEPLGWNVDLMNEPLEKVRVRIVDTSASQGFIQKYTPYLEPFLEKRGTIVYATRPNYHATIFLDEPHPKFGHFCNNIFQAHWDESIKRYVAFDDQIGYVVEDGNVRKFIAQIIEVFPQHRLGKYNIWSDNWSLWHHKDGIAKTWDEMEETWKRIPEMYERSMETKRRQEQLHQEQRS